MNTNSFWIPRLIRFPRKWVVACCSPLFSAWWDFRLLNPCPTLKSTIRFPLLLSKTLVWLLFFYRLLRLRKVNRYIPCNSSIQFAFLALSFLFFSSIRISIFWHIFHVSLYFFPAVYKGSINKREQALKHSCCRCLGARAENKPRSNCPESISLPFSSSKHSNFEFKI